MQYGMRLLTAGRGRDQIEDYLNRRLRPTLPILPFDTKAAEWQATERARLRQLGRMPGYADSQIAAIAAVNGLVVVIRNSADFRDFDDLALEGWFEA